MLSVGAAGVMCCVCGIVVETALNIAFTYLMKEFGILTSQVQWLTTGFMLVTAVMIPVSPFLNDQFNKKKIVFFGIGDIHRRIAHKYFCIRISVISCRTHCSRNRTGIGMSAHV